MRHHHGVPVFIVRQSPGGTDPYGDPIPSTTARVEQPGCAVAPRYSTEPTERGRQGVVVGWSVYLPAGADVRFTDQMELPGVTKVNAEGVTVPDPCEIEGDPGAWSSPFTGEDFGFEVTVKRAVG